MKNLNSTARFSDRVKDYALYRPSYPKRLISLLNEKIGFSEEKIVIDIGSGTGISAAYFLKNGNTVYGVEPNEGMRIAGETFLKDFNAFHSIEGTAENTYLPSNSADAIFCGQSFHWFDHEQTKTEFKRILKSNGHIVLAWNERDVRVPLSNAYEQMLEKEVTGYLNVAQRNVLPQDLKSFFEPKKMASIELSNFQDLDFTSFKERLLSSSFVPKRGAAYKKLMIKLESLYHQFQKNDRVKLCYTTKVYGNK